MDKDKLIVKQQLQIEEYKTMLEENTETIRKLKLMFYAIGAPLNDNRLKFDANQLKHCFEVYELIEQLNGI